MILRGLPFDIHFCWV